MVATDDGHVLGTQDEAEIEHPLYKLPSPRRLQKETMKLIRVFRTQPSSERGNGEAKEHLKLFHWTHCIPPDEKQNNIVPVCTVNMKEKKPRPYETSLHTPKKVRKQ